MNALMAHSSIRLDGVRQNALRAGQYLMATGLGGAVAYLIASTTSALSKAPMFPYWILAGLSVTGALLWIYGQRDSKPDGDDQVGPPGETDQANAEAAAVRQLRSETLTDVPLHVEQLLDGLGLGEHEEAERRVNRLFLHLSRDQQQATVKAVIRVATTTKDHTCELVACSLLEAADRLDPMLVKIEDVEALARSADFSLRSSAAVLMWQWAESAPGRVPIALLGKLAQPSTEDWYVHAAARAGAKQLLLRRAAARAIFDRMAASRDRNDRDYAIADLLEVARTEPRAVPADLARKLAGDRDESVAARAAELVRAVDGIGEDERRKYFSSFGM